MPKALLCANSFQHPGEQVINRVLVRRPWLSPLLFAWLLVFRSAMPVGLKARQ
jgi:hypothetical protein